MPDTGPCAPARTLVAVRAMVPVTQMPPNSAEPILATPCATSSQLERWRRPVMPSATTADRSDSMAPSSAKAMASGSTACILARLKAGIAGAGRLLGMPPKRVPMVSIGRFRTTVSTAASPTATSMPGQCGFQRLRPRMVPMDSTAIAAAATLIVPIAPPSAISLGSSSPGSLPGSVSPSRSCNWLAKMMTPMPAVKPTVTG